MIQLCTVRYLTMKTAKCWKRDWGGVTLSLRMGRFLNLGHLELLVIGDLDVWIHRFVELETPGFLD